MPGYEPMADLLGRPAQALFDRHRLLAGLVVVGLLACVYAFGSTEFPRVAAPSQAEAARQVARVFTPGDQTDPPVVGDYLVERFYVIEIGTGRRLIADICWGRIAAIRTVVRGDWAGYAYNLQLDRSGLQDKQVEQAVVGTQTAPSAQSGVVYLGLKIAGGSGGNFSVNYDGTLPDHYSIFSGPKGEGIFDYLREPSKRRIGDLATLINVQGTNYLRSDTVTYPYLGDLFSLQQAVYIAQPLIISHGGTPPN